LHAIDAACGPLIASTVQDTPIRSESIAASFKFAIPGMTVFTFQFEKRNPLQCELRGCERSRKPKRLKTF
jgi:hypothetical protein